MRWSALSGAPRCAWEATGSRRDGARKLPPTLVDLSRARALLRRVESRRCSGRQRHAAQWRPWHHSLRRLLPCGLVRGAARGLLYVTAVQWCMRNTRPRVRRTSPACLVAVCAAAARRPVAVQGGAGSASLPPCRAAACLSCSPRGHRHTRHRTHARSPHRHALTVGAAVDELRRVGDAVLREPHAQIQKIAHQPNRLVECSCNARDSTNNFQRTPYAQRSR